MPTLTLREAFTRCYEIRWSGSKGEQTAVCNSETAMEALGDEFPITKITGKVLQDYVVVLKEKGLSPATINRKVAAIMTILKVAEMGGYITSTPSIPREKEAEHRTRVLTQEEEETLLSLLTPSPNTDYSRLVVFLIDTGMRVGEALTLPWGDVKVAMGSGTPSVTVTKSKGGRPRTIPLTRRAMVALAEMGDEPGGPWMALSQSAFGHTWSKVRNRMGLSEDKEFVPHALRHTCASRLVRAGVPIQVVKEWLGHATLAMTLRYAHLDTKQMEDARDLLEVR